MSKSNILENNEDRIMLNNWIRPDTKIKFKLLYIKNGRSKCT